MGFWEKAKKKNLKSFYGILERQNDGGSHVLLKVDSLPWSERSISELEFNFSRHRQK